MDEAHFTMLYFMSAVLLITGYSTGNESIQQVITHSGATIRLNCTGMSDRGTWKGPDLTNKVEEGIDLCIIPYFDGHAKNPKIKVANVKLDTESVKKYDLVISNVTAQNLGSYQCQIRNSKVDSTFISREYRVSFKNTNKYDLDTTGATTKDQNSEMWNTSIKSKRIGQKTAHQQQNTSVLLPIVASGLFILSAVVAGVLIRTYCSRQLQTKWNAAVSYCFSSETRQNESGEADETIQGEAVQNHLYQSTQLNVVQRQRRVQLATSTTNQSSSDQDPSSLVHENLEYFHAIPVNGQRTNINRTQGARVQISDRGLNYSEVLHEPGSSNQFKEIHGLANKTIYMEIDHLRKALPLPEDTDSD